MVSWGLGAAAVKSSNLREDEEDNLVVSKIDSFHDPDCLARSVDAGCLMLFMRCFLESGVPPVGMGQCVERGRRAGNVG